MKTVIAAAGHRPEGKAFPEGGGRARTSSAWPSTRTATSSRIVDEKYPYFLDQVEQLQQRPQALRGQEESRRTRWISTTCSKKPCACCATTTTSPPSTSGSSSSCSWMNTRTPTTSRREFVDMLAAQHRTSWSSATTRSRSTRGAARTSRTSSSFPSATRTRAPTRSRRTTAACRKSCTSPTPPSRRTNSSSPRTSRPHRETRSVKPALIELNDGNQQAQFVTQRILELRDEGVELNEIAVLYRAHFHSMELQLELTRHGVPFQITSGLRFFEQAHIKDVASFLKFAANHRDEVAFKRIVRLLPGVGGVAADKLWAHFEKALEGREAVDSFTDAFAGAKVGREEREDVEAVRPHAGGNRAGRETHRAVERHRERRRGGVRRLRQDEIPQLRGAAGGTQRARQLRAAVRRPGGVPFATGARDGAGNRGRRSTPATRSATPSR